MRRSERSYPVRVQGWALSEGFLATLGMTALARRRRGYPLWVKGCALGRGLLLSPCGKSAGIANPAWRTY